MRRTRLSRPYPSHLHSRTSTSDQTKASPYAWKSSQLHPIIDGYMQALSNTQTSISSHKHTTPVSLTRWISASIGAEAMVHASFLVLRPEMEGNGPRMDSRSMQSMDEVDTQQHDRHPIALGTMEEAWNADQKQDRNEDVTDEDEEIEEGEEEMWDDEEEWDDDEGEDEEEDSEDDMRPKRAFEVVGEPDEDSGPPVDGEEYLRRVIAEAKRYPDVITSDVNPRNFDHRRTEYVPKSEPELDTDEKQLHEEAILCEIMQDFAKLRLHVASMKQYTGGENPEINQHTKQENWEQLLMGEPEAKKLTTLDQHCLGSLFLELARRANIHGQISNNDSLWMYYILAFLEKPLEKQAEMAIKYLQGQSTRLQSESSDTRVSTPNLNMIRRIAEETFART